MPAGEGFKERIESHIKRVFRSEMNIKGVFIGESVLSHNNNQQKVLDEALEKLEEFSVNAAIISEGERRK
jgi:D-ribose pyranose/furanose isomerase RbsD